MPKHLIIKDHFSTRAQGLRREFEANFKNPHDAHPKRFVWDYWNLPGQYTHLRTPAYHYFSQEKYLAFHKELVLWGRRTLGCWDISPPWLSCYIDGCEQKFHSDVPHGPWAFVFSISPSQRKFTGGETIMMRPETLEYWNGFDRRLSLSPDREFDSFFHRVSAKFNRLTVFDPRFPHGVSRVSGTSDPSEGRLVIHGWFTEPKTYIEGALSASVCEKKLNLAFDKVQSILPNYPNCQGTLSLGIQASPSGKVTSVKFLTNALRSVEAGSMKNLNLQILKIYQQISFSKSKGRTNMTVPLIFQ